MTTPSEREAGAGMRRPRPRWLLSYRLSLAAIPVLAASMGVAVAITTYLHTRGTIGSLADVLFRQVAQEAMTETQHFARQAIPAVEYLTERDDLTDDPRTLARKLTSVLKANPGFAWVSYGRADGAFTGAYRTPEGTLRVNLSSVREGKTELFEHTVAPSGEWSPSRHDPDTGYDPRTRPFYLKAQQAGRRVWTDPYVFYEQAVPGLTCAAPRFSEAGTLLGVFTVDFDLNHLSLFMQRLQPSPHGRVFVFTPDGTLLAHPTARAVVHPGQRGAGKLLSLRDADDAAIPAYLAELSRVRGAAPIEAGAPRQFAFDAAGARFLGSYVEFEVDEGLRWAVGVIAPEDDFLAPVRQNHGQALLVSFLTLLLGLALALLLATRVAGPLAQLATDMEAVGRFHLEPTPERPTLFREIAAMSHAVSSMKSGLRSFAAYVPRDLVRRVLASGRPASLEGEVREMTVFFADVENFTTIAEAMRPEQLVRFLALYLEQVTRIIAEQRGTVDKYLGDGVMAFWNAPEPTPEHAVRACEAAMRCRDMLDELSRARGDRVRLRARIGIATGEVLVGNIGTQERMNYTVLGDVVNVASRLEGLNKVYGTAMLISEATRRAAGDRIVARPVDLVALKGKAKPVKVYEVFAMSEGSNPALASLAADCERAFEAYLRRDFSAAVAGWEAALRRAPHDLAARRMLERARAWEARPPPPDWTGVWAAPEK